MSAFPGSIVTFAGFISSHTLSADNHASQHNSEQAEIIATETKVGTGSSTPVTNTLLRGTGTGTSSWAQANLTTDVTGILPQANGGTGGNVVFLALIYPIGCIYTEITGTNPNTTFGFGTWVQFGQGQVLVGQKAADVNFGSVLNSGGEVNHTLTSAEMPSHTHTITDPGHTHTYPSPQNVASGANFTTAALNAGTPTATSSNTTGITVNSTGSDGGHNNLQPYIVVYFWRRTV